MFNANRPLPSDLPSTGKLVRSTILAAAVAAGILVTVVMPAEYGIDPTRVGSLFGLTEMGRIKVQLAAEAEAEEAEAKVLAAAPAASQTPVTTPAPITGGRSDQTVIALAPDQGAEIKLVMAEGAKVQFVWVSSGGRVNYDTHADRPGVSYHGYGKGSSEKVEGELVAAFDGSHGWFWRNRTGKPVTVTLQTKGAYSEIKRVV